MSVRWKKALGRREEVGGSSSKIEQEMRQRERKELERGIKKKEIERKWYAKKNKGKEKLDMKRKLNI